MLSILNVTIHILPKPGICISERRDAFTKIQISKKYDQNLNGILKIQICI